MILLPKTSLPCWKFITTTKKSDSIRDGKIVTVCILHTAFSKRKIRIGSLIGDFFSKPMENTPEKNQFEIINLTFFPSTKNEDFFDRLMLFENRRDGNIIELTYDFPFLSNKIIFIHGQLFLHSVKQYLNKNYILQS